MQDLLVVGCGYLGRRLAERCLRAGRRVLATTRSVDRATEFRAAGIEPIVCDVTRPETLDTLPQVATVVHCVGLDRTAETSMREVYVDGLRNLLGRLPMPGRLIHVSSTSVYGQQAGEEVDETAVTEPAEESGRVVLDAENALRSQMPTAIILRFAGIYGPERLMRLDALRNGEPMPMNPDRWVNLLHVDDGVTAVLAAEELGRPGEVYNVCDDRPVLRREFYECLARHVGAPPPRFVTPPTGTAISRDATNRRIVNRRMREALGVKLAYPNYMTGITASA